MGAGSHLSTPVAIVIASAVVATGVYFGLRAQAPAPAPAPAAPVPAPAPPLDRAQVAEHALAALAYQRPHLLARCYRPAAAAAAEPPIVRYQLDLSFDASGAQVMRGIVELEGDHSPELTRCVTEALTPLLIPPPGAPASVEIPLRFP